MENVSRVVLAVEEHAIAEEVMHFLDRSGRVRVVATAGDGRQLSEAVRQLEPDVVVGSPSLLTSGRANGCRLLALDTAESVRSLRTAIDAGAGGYFLWPSQRDELVHASARASRSAAAAGALAPVVAVCASRGGVGATFIATHVAAAVARRGRRCVLVDLDLHLGDLAWALGVGDLTQIRTLADLVPIADEASSDQLDQVLWTHDAGFRVLFAASCTWVAPYGSEQLAAAVDAVRSAADVVLAHVPRGGAGAEGVIDLARRVLVVLQPDVASFRAARQIVDGVGTERCHFVFNRAARAELVPADVERAFGRPAIAVVPADRAVGAAQDRGRLLPPRGRTGRAVQRLADRVLEEVA